MDDGSLTGFQLLVCDEQRIGCCPWRYRKSSKVVWSLVRWWFAQWVVLCQRGKKTAEALKVVDLTISNVAVGLAHLSFWSHPECDWPCDWQFWVRSAGSLCTPSPMIHSVVIRCETQSACVSLPWAPNRGKVTPGPAGETGTHASRFAFAEFSRGLCFSSLWLWAVGLRTKLKERVGSGMSSPVQVSGE